MRTLTLSILLLIITALPMQAVTPVVTDSQQPAPPTASSTAGGIAVGERLKYNIYFHMGFIWATAGYGELSFVRDTRHGQPRLRGQLAAKSLSIVEHIMRVRDTLDCWFNAEMVPTEFRKATHEGNYNAIAHNHYTPYWRTQNATHTPRNVDSTHVTINRWRQKAKEAARTEALRYTNPGIAYDMLSVFYTVRSLDYAKMKKGTRLHYVCYDGIKRQTIRVEYQGTARCELRNDQKHDAYLIHLTFDTKGQEATPLRVWLSTTPDHHPIKAIIALKRIGSVQCEIIE